MVIAHRGDCHFEHRRMQKVRQKATKSGQNTGKSTSKCASLCSETHKPSVLTRASEDLRRANVQPVRQFDTPKRNTCSIRKSKKGVHFYDTTRSSPSGFTRRGPRAGNNSCLSETA